MTATATAPTLVEAITFINSTATDSDLERVIDAVKARRKALMAQRAAVVGVGTTGTLADLSPKYLNGMRGEVTLITGQKAVVRLDETSTTLLRYSGSRFHVPAGQTNYTITVPLTCVVPD